MKRLHWGAAALALATVLTPVGTSAHAEDGGHGDDLPDRVELPDGWQPEGITTDGRSLFVGSLANGALFEVDPRTGEGEVLARGRKGRVAVGVDYDRLRDLLWVAGGATKVVRAHDADTGRVVATYRFPSTGDRFLNDIVVTRRGVFATDSMNQELAVVPLRRHGKHLPPRSAAETLPLTGDLEYVEGFNLNGIVRYEGALLSVQSNTGELFRINQRTGDTEEVDLGGATLANGDGLERDDDLLYVVRNQDHLVAVVELDEDDDEVTGRVVAELTSDDFDVPTTAALARDSLWVVNARFGVTPTPETDYWVTRVDEFDD